VYKKVLYKKAYRLLKNSTPMKFDCGLICNGKCCTGDRDMGMCLYPGEESLLQGYADFLDIRNDRLRDMDVLFATCKGSCNRRLRPLACRIYPLAPYLNEDSRLDIIQDPRAKYICPLLMKSFDLKIDRAFKRNVKNAFRILIQDEEIRSYIELLSSILDDYKKLTW
jgi:hypothetical protein